MTPSLAETSLRSVAANGRAVSYRSAGRESAPAIVMLHGIGSASLSWEAQLASFAAQGFRAIAWDAPGYGRSDDLPIGAPHPEDYADALDGFLAALGIARCLLIGHSLGALMAGAFCAGPGARKIERLILASPAVGYANAPEPLRRTRTEGRIADMTMLGPGGIAEKRAPALVSKEAKPETVERLRQVMRELRPEGYAQAARMLGQADLLALALGIALPTLVLCGSADTVTPEESCRRVAAAISGAEYRTLPGAGHACYVEAPALFDAAVFEFFAGVV